MGVTFKENCPDIRNSKVRNLIDSINSFEGSSFEISIHDPWLSESDFSYFTDTKIVTHPKINHYDVLMIAVGHNEFKKMGPEKLKSFVKKNSIIYDLKYVLRAEESDMRL